MAESKINQKRLNGFLGFSKLTRDQRFERLQKMGALTPDDIKILIKGGLDHQLAEKFIENVIGCFQLPLGVATNFVVDGKALVIPMAVEETSIVAAASKTAKWVREHGSITTTVIGSDIIGQIQISKLKDPVGFEQKVRAQIPALVASANQEIASGLVARGGGVRDIQIRILNRDDGGFMGIVHVLCNPCDAMGANIMNQICEFLKHPLQEITGESVTMCILSNLVDTKLTRAEVALTGLEPDLMERIQEASYFAELDPYRAATNNKGVLNGIDPILIATGNDWRAVEAGVHAFAAREGRYKSITRWRVQDKILKGVLEAPIVVGIVGGVTKLHPTAQLCLRMLEAQSANDLSRICGAVGLVQNLGALRALTTVGIIEGHMKLHIRNLSLGAGASDAEIPFMQKRLEEILSFKKHISLSHAVEVLREIRSQVVK